MNVAATSGASVPPARQGAAPAEIGFDALFSSLNPLHHVPVVSSAYAAATGDRPVPAARILIATLIGGPIGLVTSVVDSILTEATGRGFAEHAWAMLQGAGPDPQDNLATESDPAQEPQGLASAMPPPRSLLPPRAVAEAAPADDGAAAMPQITAAPRLPVQSEPLAPIAVAAAPPPDRSDLARRAPALPTIAPAATLLAAEAMPRSLLPDRAIAGRLLPPMPEFAALAPQTVAAPRNLLPTALAAYRAGAGALG